MPIYKYVIPDRVDVLEGRRIRFTPPGAQNDLFEVKPYFESIMTDDEWREAAEAEEVRKRMEDELRKLYDAQRIGYRMKNPWPVFRAKAFLRPEIEQIKREAIAEVRAMVHPEIPNIRALAEQLMQQIGILSLATRADSPTMWSYYAQNNEGFVIGFDESHPWFDRRVSPDSDYDHLQRVIYEDPPEKPRTMSQIDGRRLLITKGTAWAQEEEWRMLTPLIFADTVLPIGSEHIHLFNVPPSAITDVYLGVKTTRALEDRIRDLLNAHGDLSHISMHRGRRDERSQRIVFDPIAR